MLDFAQARTTMVDTQVRPNDVTRFQVIEAMLTVPREVFVPAARRAIAYAGGEVPLPGGRVLLEPRTLAKLIDALDPGPGELALDVAAATGYAAALLGRMTGAVVAVDEPALSTAAEAALAEAGVANVAVVEGAPSAGWAAQAPYDAIVVSGGAVEVIPDAVLDQLAEGGRIAALFLRGDLGVARLGRKIRGEVSWRDLFNANAPLLPGFARPRGFTF